MWCPFLCTKSGVLGKTETVDVSWPIGSMYAIYGNIYHQYTPNVSVYTIHGSYGWCFIIAHFLRRKHDTSAWPGSGDAPEDGPMDLCRVQLDGVREGGFAGTSSSATLGVSQECLRFRMFHDVPHGFLSGVPWGDLLGWMSYDHMMSWPKDLRSTSWVEKLWPTSCIGVKLFKYI